MIIVEANLAAKTLVLKSKYFCIKLIFDAKYLFFIQIQYKQINIHSVIIYNT